MNRSASSRRRSRSAARTVAALTGVFVVLAVALGAGQGAPAAGAAPAAAAPAAPGAGTRFLDHSAYLRGFAEPEWYEANVPFVDLPDTTMQDVYYYRWRTWKEHLRYTNPTDGWILTEFLDCCGYAAPYQAVDAAAGHHISEGRWVRDRTYLDDYTRFWLTGPGAGPKPAEEGVNPDTTDWAHEYSFWLASAAYDRAEVTGDLTGLAAMLPQLERQYRGWDGQFDAALGLYWSVPVWDAMELSASSYQSSDPYHGGAGFRPTLNSYQYGDAQVISRLATLTGDTATARQYADRAAGLKAAMHRWLWDPSRGFYYSMARDGNPEHRLLDTREETGFLPWQFGAAQPADASAWAQLLDPQGFAAAYGPTTAERRSPWFLHDADGCCRWDGPSWPFSTSQTLAGMADLLDDGPPQQVVTKEDYAAALATYARTQTKDGVPYVAEAHAPDDPRWIYDGRGHSEDYNHSTYDDLVLSGLLGLRPQDGPTLEVKPLVPASWDHFAVENAPYHGHDVTVLWDRDGHVYGQGAGLRVYVDGRLTRQSPGLTALTVSVGATVPPAPQPRSVDDAANPLRTGFPKPIATYTSPNDDPWNPLDGKVWYAEVPENTRWTDYGSPHPQDSYGVDFGAPTLVQDLRWSGYDDGGGVRPAADYRVQSWTGSDWADVPGQVRSSAPPVGNGVNRVTFPPVTTSKVRLLFTRAPGAFVGVTELQSWSPSSRDLGLTVGPVGPDGAVVVHGATSVTVTGTNTTGRKVLAPQVALAVPDGWQVRPAGVSGLTQKGDLAPQASARWSFTLVPPVSVVPGTDAAVVATATYGDRDGPARTTHARSTVTTAFDPAAFPVAQVQDDFTADTSGTYRLLQPFPEESLPAVAAGGGTWTASADRRFFTLADSGTSPATSDAVAVVEPARFLGPAAAQEDSLFVGLVRDDRTYVTAWYNNHFTSSGIDVRVDGAFGPGGTGAYAGTIGALAPGDQLALQLHGTTLTSWAGHAGAWRRLATTDLGAVVDLADPAVRARWSFAFGVRGDAGTLSVGAFSGRSLG